MNIVYFLVNRTRQSKGLKPFKYIGSKTLCKVENGKIYSLKTGNEYKTSSKTVKESILAGDVWEMEGWFEVLDRERTYEIEGIQQDFVKAKDNPDYYNKSHANLKFNSCDPETGRAISRRLKGRVHPYMRDEKYWIHLQSSEVRQKNSAACKGNPNVINAAKKRSERWKNDPEWVKMQSERARKTFTGRKKSEHEIQLRTRDDRYKSNRKMTNEQVWNIRFGTHKELSLNDLMTVYIGVTKATLCRVKNFKVFKDINEGWINHEKGSHCSIAV